MSYVNYVIVSVSFDVISSAIYLFTYVHTSIHFLLKLIIFWILTVSSHCIQIYEITRSSEYHQILAFYLCICSHYNMCWIFFCDYFCSYWYAHSAILLHLRNFLMCVNHLFTHYHHMQIMYHSQLPCYQTYLRTHVMPLNTYMLWCTATVPFRNKEMKVSTFILKTYFCRSGMW